MGPVPILPVVTKDLRNSPRLSRCKFSTLTSRQPMVEFLITHALTLSATEERTQIMVARIELTTSALSRCAGYLLEHSGDEGMRSKTNK